MLPKPSWLEGVLTVSLGIGEVAAAPVDPPAVSSRCARFPQGFRILKSLSNIET